MTPMSKAALAAALTALATLAQTAEVYRCGRSYQDQPCLGAQVIEVDDHRDARQQRDALNATQASQRLARQMAAERRQRERDIQPQTAAVGIALRQPQFTPREDASAAANPCLKKRSSASRNNARCVGGQPLFTAPAAGHQTVQATQQTKSAKPKKAATAKKAKNQRNGNP